MENTSPLLFDNVDERYFLAAKGRAIGPLTAQDVYEKIQNGHANLLDYFWTETWSDWKRICEARDFAMLVPQKPPASAIAQIKDKLDGKRRAKAKSAPPEPPASESRSFYLYFNSSQYGPFSPSELEHVLKSHKLGRNAYAWTPGWPNWKRLSEIAEFQKHLPPKERTSSGATGKIVKTKTSPSDKRRAPRKPLVARLFLHNDKDVIIAVCRDISVGGMQVLTDRVPGPVGTLIKLNVSPGDPSKVKGFVAEGEIVRVLEDGRGFSFRFRKISDDAKRAIEKYIRSSD